MAFIPREALRLTVNMKTFHNSLAEMSGDPHIDINASSQPRGAIERGLSKSFVRRANSASGCIENKLKSELRKSAEIELDSASFNRDEELDSTNEGEEPMSLEAGLSLLA